MACRQQNGIGAVELDRGADDAGAERFGDEQHIAGLGAGVRGHARRIHGAGHGVAELDLLILHGVTAEQRHSGLAQLVEAAAKNRGDGPRLESILRKCRDRKRRERTSAHRIDVADRVRGGDLAVGVRVVHDRREKIDRLHQRRSAFPREHTRIVRRPEVDKDTGIKRRRDVTQHLSELASGEFARSTGAGRHLSQTLRHLFLLSVGYDTQGRNCGPRRTNSSFTSR